ncbi:uncharacterized protein HMPREF1541_02992 [Cyphellophora europaea CBS 101466]|uniref:Uncharacterized protein n=1 Tax=Cyphellophora europaea (strain CBS 101466) TaxID=1220924 RepID=W2RX84_CYPE1|nr:uncharacterized protein HMPREF1541_02992 [Cyphellophora europaea CBS 101466]ETN41057.1 hypothetical protein HMPREF1541_02992 [Cyphellophora europaea CBS 101466]
MPSCDEKIEFNPATDIPSLTGKTILVTGANAGLGYQSVHDLAKHQPAHIIMAARSIAKAEEATRKLRETIPGLNTQFTPLPMDLSSLASVHAAAVALVTSFPDFTLDILILNAGIMMHPPSVTADGYELQMATNHLGHALLTKLLLPSLLRSPDPRVVVVSSDLLSSAPKGGIIFPALKTPQAEISDRARYGQSKLANALYARALARHYPKLTVAATHPGVYATGLQDKMAEGSIVIRGLRATVGGWLMKDPSEGTRNQLWAATAKQGVVSGEYYVPVGEVGKAKMVRDDKLTQELWRWTEEQLRVWET